MVFVSYKKNCIRKVPFMERLILFSPTSGGNAYQDRNAIMNPKVEKKKVLPWGSKGLRTGID